MFRSKVNSQGAGWQKSLFIYFNKKKIIQKIGIQWKKILENDFKIWNAVI